MTRSFDGWCTINWIAENLAFDASGVPIVPPTDMYFGKPPNEYEADIDLDFCEGALALTTPPLCEPGTVAVDSDNFSFSSATGVISVPVVEGGLDAVSSPGRHRAVLGTASNDGPVHHRFGFGRPDHLIRSIAHRRRTGCGHRHTPVRLRRLPEFDFDAVLPRDMATGAAPGASDVPGEQRACVLERTVTACEQAIDTVCTTETFGQEGDSRYSRTF